jgi:stringent starvation protein B
MSTSNKPYLIRALHQWCGDNDLTPYVVVWVDEHTDVPREFVQKNEIVLNVSLNATKDLEINNDWLSFQARFGGIARHVWVPMGNIMSIFARESGEGMGFEVELDKKTSSRPLHAVEDAAAELPPAENAQPEKPKGRPSLHIVK